MLVAVVQNFSENNGATYPLIVVMTAIIVNDIMTMDVRVVMAPVIP